LWPEGVSANSIHIEIHPKYGARVLGDQRYMFGVRSLLILKKLLMNSDLPMQTASAASIIFHQAFNLVDSWGKCLNEYGKYI